MKCIALIVTRLKSVCQKDSLVVGGDEWLYVLYKTAVVYEIKADIKWIWSFNVGEAFLNIFFI